MFATSPIKRAAQYVRMSTDQQQYSTVNQLAAIAAWAVERGVQIVATYEDAGKSGLTLAGRPALRQMIADVVSGPRTFDAILVYDVSRWGRFQDADESAHLEFLCRSSGVSVHYCAEPFVNDGSPLANLCKVLKRALAAEYSRELSEKVSVGKARLAGLGFHQGSVPGYALQRRLLDRHGTDKGPLAFGERKSLITDRVTLTPSTPDEVATVIWMYEAYADKGLSMAAIRNNLNARSVLRDGRPWSKKAVYTVLTSPRYVGDNVWGTTSCKLRAPKRNTPRETWTTCEGAFAPIVSRDLFDRAQKRRATWPKRLPDEQLIERLRSLLRSEGRVTCRLMAKHGLVADVYQKRFGSLDNAYALCGADPIAHPRDAKCWEARLEGRKKVRDELRNLVETSGGTFAWHELNGDALVNDEICIFVYVAATTNFRITGRKAWQIGVRRCTQDFTVMAMLDDDFGVRGYFILPSQEAMSSCKFREQNEPCLELFRAKSLTDLSAITRRAPLLMAALPTPNAKADKNPYEIGRPAAGIPRRSQPWKKRSNGTYYRPQRALAYVACYFARKRRLIERAAATRSLTIQLIDALCIFLRRPGVSDCLRTAGLVDAPAALFEARASLSAAEELNTMPSQSIACGPRDKDGLYSYAAALFAGRKLSPDTIACLARMKDERQVEAAREMLMEQRCSYQLARVLLSLTPPDQLTDPHLRPKISGGPRIFQILAREASKLDRAHRFAMEHYPAEAFALASLTAFARRLVEAECLAPARTVAGARSVNKLKRALADVMTWRAAKSPQAFSRGRVT